MTGPAPLVLCGPSGAGKSTLLKKMMEKYKQYFGFSVSHTTRSARPGEENGVAYNFVSKEEMQKAIDNDEFIEHATFAGNMYGTSKAAVQTVMEKGRVPFFLPHNLLPCIFRIDLHFRHRCSRSCQHEKNFFQIKLCFYHATINSNSRGKTERTRNRNRRVSAKKTGSCQTGH